MKGDSDNENTRKHVNAEVRFVKFYQDAAGWLIDMKLTARQYRLLFALLETLEYENFVRVSQKDLAERIGIHVQDVSTGLKVLIDHGILLEGRRNGRNKTYRLNSEVAFKGRELDKVIAFPRAQEEPTPLKLLKSKKKVKPPTQ